LSELSRLPPAQRLQRYRELAAQARRDADRTQGADHAAFLNLAEGWERLARTLESCIISRASETVPEEMEHKEAALRVQPKTPEGEN
jgi:hypothetical protein